MKHYLASSLLFALSAASAQPVSFDSVRLADTLMESSWSSLEPILPVVIAGIENTLKTNGFTEHASKVYGEELRRIMSKDNFSRAVAVTVTAKFSPEEIRDISVFLQSKVGLKYLSLNKELASNTEVLLPLVKQACRSTVERLKSAADQTSMRDTCARL